MKYKNLILNLSVCITAIIFGIAWVGIYRFSLQIPKEVGHMPSIGENYGKSGFDINDPSSVLPIDFEEDQLTSPHDDETNEELFDPEGNYYFTGNPKGFEDFYYIVIENKNFSVGPKNSAYGDPIPLKGFVLTERSGNPEYLDFEFIRIEDGKLVFETKAVNGIKYAFNGDFTVKGNFYTLDENSEVLKGSLTKYVNGKISAQANFSFLWILELGCGQ